VAVHSDAARPDRGRVLLTGAHGFTGGYLRNELEAAGYRVVGTAMAGPVTENDIALDITSLDNCRQVIETVPSDYVVNLAAISFVEQTDAELFYKCNVVGTLNLLQALAESGATPRRVVIVSSANVYGNATAGVIDESAALQPVNHYAASKLAMEYMARTWCDRLPIVITRPFNYTGVGQAPNFLVPKIVSHFERHAPAIELGNLDVERDFSDVRMVVKAYRALLESDCAGQVINICSGRPYSLADILNMMQAITGYEIDVKVNPALVRRTEVKTLVGSPDKLRRLTGDIDVIPLEQTLRWMAHA
jgi:nucleoside-diphosphate-sugar epimerase